MSIAYSYCLLVSTAFMYVSMLCSHHVRSKVDAEDGDGAQWQWDVDQDEEQEGGDLWDVAGQSVSDRLLQVVKDQTAWKDGGDESTNQHEVDSHLF